MHPTKDNPTAKVTPSNQIGEIRWLKDGVMARIIQKAMATAAQTRQKPSSRISKKQALKRLASIIEESMEGLSEAEKDRRVKRFGERVNRAVDRAKSAS
jgi:hypothetical protein